MRPSSITETQTHSHTISDDSDDDKIQTLDETYTMAGTLSTVEKPCR